MRWNVVQSLVIIKYDAFVNEALTVLIDHQTVGTVCQRLGTAWSQMAWPFD